MSSRRRFGTLLLEAGVITPEQHRQAMGAAETSGKRLGETIVDLGFATEAQVIDCLGVHLGYAVVRLAHTYIDPAVARALPEPFCRNEAVLPLYRAEGRTIVAMCDPLDIVAVDETRKALGTDVEVLVAGRSDLFAALDRVFGRAPAPAPAAETPAPTPAEALLGIGATENAPPLRARGHEIGEEGVPVAKILEGIFHRALSERVSEVHLEPKARHLAVRFRIDGEFHALTSVPTTLAGPILARLRLLAGLDVGERSGEPVEGRFHLRSGLSDPPVEVRLAVAPTIHGDRAVLRVVRRADILRPIEALGFEAEQHPVVRRVVESRRGLVLVSGPTGAGVTTTLYSLLGALDRPEVNILTAEDPVEYPVATFNQMRLPPSGTPDFQATLRAIERQAPDVVLLSEVRDRETVAAAIRLAETGRLVLTSVHADDAVTAYWPLFRWGADPHAVASILVASIAVRLARLTCPACAEAYHAAPEVLARLGGAPNRAYRRGRGCEACLRTGAVGRTGLFEVFTPPAHVRELVADRASSDVVRRAAVDAGMATLRDAGLAKVARDVTSPDEILRTLA